MSKVETAAPDLIISDTKMAEMDGFEARRAAVIVAAVPLGSDPRPATRSDTGPYQTLSRAKVSPLAAPVPRIRY